MVSNVRPVDTQGAANEGPSSLCLSLKYDKPLDSKTEGLRVGQGTLEQTVGSGVQDEVYGCSDFDPVVELTAFADSRSNASRRRCPIGNVLVLVDVDATTHFHPRVVDVHPDQVLERLPLDRGSVQVLPLDFYNSNGSIEARSAGRDFEPHNLL